MKRMMISLVVVVILAGCSDIKAANVDALWDWKSGHVGNNSAVINILGEAGSRELGDYTIQLHTTTDPYGLTVSYSNVTDQFSKETAERISALAVGLIGNLSYVEVKSPEKTYRFTEKSLNKELKMKVKDMSKDKAKLEQFLQQPQKN